MSAIRRLVVVTGDHQRVDSTKLAGAWGAQDLTTHREMVKPMESLARFEVTVVDNHTGLFERLLQIQPDLV